MRASIYLLELDADTGAGTETLGFASEGYTTRPSDTPANAHYPARIINIGSIEQHMFERGRTMGAAALTLGEVTLGNMDGGLNALRDYDFDGRAARLLRLDGPEQAYDDAEVMFVSTIATLDWSDGDAPRVQFYDKRRLLDLPLLTERYDGTTTSGGLNTANGTPDMEGQIIKQVWGRALSVEATIANPYDVILQFSAGAVDDIDLYDGGAPITYDGDNANLVALISASQNPGHFRSVLDLGVVRPGGSRAGRADYVWFADVTEGATLADRTAGQVALRLLAHMGYSGSDVDVAAFDALDLAATAETGVLVDSETPAISIIRQVLGSVGAYLGIDAQGRFTVGRFTGVGTSLGTIREQDVIDGVVGAVANPDTPDGLPAKTLKLQWGRRWRPMSPTEIPASVSTNDPARAEALGQDVREVVIENSAVATANPLAGEIVIETMLVSKAEAEAEADRLNGLYGTWREVVSLTLPREVAAPMLLGTSWTLGVDRIDLSGRDVVVIGREIKPSDETVTLWLWG